MPDLPRLAAAIGGLSFLITGGWATLAPRSFYENVALWPPYNHHFLHDIGAFQIGLGLVLLLALAWRDPLTVTLSGVAAGQTIHALVHVIDRDLGGRTSDPLVMAVVAAALVVAAVARRRASSR